MTVCYQGNDGHERMAYDVPSGTLAEDFLAAHDGRCILWISAEMDPPAYDLRNA